MDYDFHYYATYAAARITGWSKEESLTIAEAALFVDYCDYNNFAYSYKLGEVDLGVPVLTSQYLATYEYKDANDPSIWVPFHFLPGNYNSDKSGEGHKVRTVVNGVKRGAYICRPHSALSKSMAEHTINAYQALMKEGYGKTAKFLVGLRMHIFIDTWAHQDFTGFNQRNINDCGLYVWQISSDGRKNELNIDFSKSEYDYQAAPPYTNSYMGHGRLGHLPDMGWMKMVYQPAWAKKDNNEWGDHARDNPREFTEAFIGMVKLLYKIRHGNELDVTIVDVSRLNNDKLQGLINNDDGAGTISIPDTLIDLISKKQNMGNITHGAFPSAANDWCRELVRLNLLDEDPLRNLKDDGGYDFEWEKKLVNHYKSSFKVEGYPNIIQPWTRPASLHEGSDFLAFQEAAALHMNFFIKELESEPVLHDGKDHVLVGWSVSNSSGFQRYVEKKYPFIN